MAFKINFVETTPAHGWIDLLESIAVTLTNPVGGEDFLAGAVITVDWTLDNPDVPSIDPKNLRVELDRLNAGTFAQVAVAAVDALTLTANFTATPTPTKYFDSLARLRLVHIKTGDILATSNTFTLSGTPKKINFKGAFSVSGA